jgi:hypothetical protein
VMISADCLATVATFHDYRRTMFRTRLAIIAALVSPSSALAAPAAPEPKIVLAFFMDGKVLRGARPSTRCASRQTLRHCGGRSGRNLPTRHERQGQRRL